MPSRHWNMFNLRLCNAATIQYSQLKFGHMHLFGMDYKYSSPHCCQWNSLGYTAAMRYGNACCGPHTDSLYSGSEHSQFNSQRLVKQASPTHGGRWLAQTNYDALMTHHTTENKQDPTLVITVPAAALAPNGEHSAISRHAQACFPLAQPNFHSHWQVPVSQPV